MKNSKLLSLTAFTLLMIPSAFADLATKELSDGEVCKILDAIPGLNVQGPTKKETALCGYEFYNDPKIGICAKGNSTNPGVSVFELQDGSSKKAFEEGTCWKKKFMGAKKIAKFKSTITCSYTPSILAYYQVSRFLNGAGHVPTSVYRTMNGDQHDRIIKQGASTAIHGSWALFAQDQANPAAHKDIFIPAGGGKYDVYGALSDSPKNEFLYNEFVGPRKNYADGLNAFQKTGPYNQVISASSLSQLAPTKTLAGAAPIVQTMKDMTDMIVLDTLLSQQDRFGNEAYQRFYQYIENSQVKSEKYDDNDKDQAADMKNKGAVLVKVNVMKDNDCGVDKTNWMKKAKLIENVKHIDPATYNSVLRLAETLDKDGTNLENYFKSELLFNNSDWITFANNLHYIASTLQAHCKAGSLKQDLNIEEYLGLKGGSHSCDVQ